MISQAENMILKASICKRSLFFVFHLGLLKYQVLGLNLPHLVFQVYLLFLYGLQAIDFLNMVYSSCVVSRLLYINKNITLYGICIDLIVFKYKRGSIKYWSLSTNEYQNIKLLFTSKNRTTENQELHIYIRFWAISTNFIKIYTIKTS